MYVALQDGFQSSLTGLSAALGDTPSKRLPRFTRRTDLPYCRTRGVRKTHVIRSIIITTCPAKHRIYDSPGPN